MNYLLVKHLHVTAAGLSILFFLVRAYWSVVESPLLKARAVRIGPHIIDTVLLVCGILLTVMWGSLQGWIVAKLVALVLYVIVGTIAIKRGRTPRTRAWAALVAVAIFLYIVGVGLAHNPYSWFA